MAKTKLDLYSKNDTALQQFAETHHQKLTGNPDFASPTPTGPEFATVLTYFSDTIDEVEQNEAALQESVSRKNQAREQLMQALTQRGSYVDTASAGDPTKILSTGFEVSDTNRTPADLTAPEHLTASIGDRTGELDLAWDAVPRARAYIVEIRINDETLPWQQATFSTRSRVTIPNLEAGKTYAARVKAIGAKGDSPWSVVVVKTVA